MDQASTRIERFLRDHPQGQLTVCVGYASLAGVAWLLNQASTKNYDAIRIIVGNLDDTYGYDYPEHHARSILEFFDRWPQIYVEFQSANQSQGLMHTKIFVVNNNETYFVLQGSANLTHGGLFVNTESMSEVTSVEIPDFLNRVSNVIHTANNVTDEFRQYIHSGVRPQRNMQNKVSIGKHAAQGLSRRMKRVIAIAIVLVVAAPLVAVTTSSALTGTVLAFVVVGILEVYLRRSRGLES